MENGEYGWVVDALFVTELGVSVVEDPAEDEPRRPIYSILLKGTYEEGGDAPGVVALALRPQLAAILAAKIARGAVEACDDLFVTALLVAATESKAESQQFLSQHLGHGEGQRS